MKRSRLYGNCGYKHPKSRKEAMDIGVDFFFTGKPCVRGHVSLRYALSGNCTACQQTRNNDANYADERKVTPNLSRIDDALADKALARELKEVWDE